MFFERPEAGRQAVLLNIGFGNGTASERGAALATARAELTQLVESAAIAPVGCVEGTREKPHSRWFVGQGKLDEIGAALAAGEADLLIANHDLTPAQERNLEARLGCRVMTRTELILHIFAARARTREGQLQIELAQLNHARTRMARGWAHLDRQRGGVGLRGAGEKQIELDARMLNSRIRVVRERLQRVHGQREGSRRHRRRTGVPTIALVGYTNAGKSTLFNALTAPQGQHGTAYVADQLFATLDPLMRRVHVEGAGEVVLADTVGFIRDLPPGFTEAFKATLEQVAEADLLLHVIDAAAPDAAALRDHVLGVLADIGAADVPTIEVWNKVDLLREAEAGEVSDGLNAPAPPGTTAPRRVAVSASAGTCLDTLRTALATAIGVTSEPLTVFLEPDAGKLRAHLYALGAVRSEAVGEDGRLVLAVTVDAAEARRLRSAGLVAGN